MSRRHITGYLNFLPKQKYPIRTGVHPNTAFGLSFALDYARAVGHKDLTKLVKEGANVPVYVLEYLLGTYCASSDETVISEGMKTVKKVLAENYVRPDEAARTSGAIGGHAEAVSPYLRRAGLLSPDLSPP